MKVVLLATNAKVINKSFSQFFFLKNWIFSQEKLPFSYYDGSDTAVTVADEVTLSSMESGGKLW